MVNDTIVWSVILALCIVALFVEAARIFVALFRVRATIRHYALVLLPLAGSVWSFAVLVSALDGAAALWTELEPLTQLHFSVAMYEMFKQMFAQFTVIFQQQTAITLGIFILVLFLEGRLLPRDHQGVVLNRAKD